MVGWTRDSKELLLDLMIAPNNLLILKKGLRSSAYFTEIYIQMANRGFVLPNVEDIKEGSQKVAQKWRNMLKKCKDCIERIIVERNKEKITAQEAARIVQKKDLLLIKKIERLVEGAKAGVSASRRRLAEGLPLSDSEEDASPDSILDDETQEDERMEALYVEQDSDDVEHVDDAQVKIAVESKEGNSNAEDESEDATNEMVHNMIDETLRDARGVQEPHVCCPRTQQLIENMTLLTEKCVQMCEGVREQLTHEKAEREEARAVRGRTNELLEAILLALVK